MIDLASKVIVFEKEVHPILRWEVWWRTPTGLFRGIDSALHDALSKEFPPDMIRAVPVAVGETVYEER